MDNGGKEHEHRITQPQGTEAAMKIVRMRLRSVVTKGQSRLVTCLAMEGFGRQIFSNKATARRFQSRDSLRQT